MLAFILCAAGPGFNSAPGAQAATAPKEKPRENFPEPALGNKWQERQDSNPRPLVLETSALAKLSYAPVCRQYNPSGGAAQYPIAPNADIPGYEPDCFTAYIHRIKTRAGPRPIRNPARQGTI